MIMAINGDLFQWDLGRSVIYTPENGEVVEELHFANPGDAKAQVMEAIAEDGAYTAEIPNILLQKGKSICVWAVNTTEDVRHTVKQAVLPVRKRERPADYVYTQTEVKSYAALENRLEKLEQGGIGGGVTEEQVESAVNKYLDENPITPGATAEQAAQIASNTERIKDLEEADGFTGASDFVVTFTPNWEEVYNPDSETTEPQIVSYTADKDYVDIAAAFAEGIVVIAKWSDDNGAVWNVACGGYADQEMPNVKVGPFVHDGTASEYWYYVAESDAGSEEAGGGAEWETIVDITTTEEITAIDIAADQNGEPFELVEAEVRIEVVGTATNTAEAALSIRTGANSASMGGTNASATRMFRNAGTNLTVLSINCHSGFICGQLYNIGNSTGVIAGYFNKHFSTLSYLRLYGGTFGVGSRVVIKGVRV